MLIKGTVSVIPCKGDNDRLTTVLDTFFSPDVKGIDDFLGLKNV